MMEILHPSSVPTETTGEKQEKNVHILTTTVAGQD
jgi:hypothetical protein